MRNYNMDFIRGIAVLCLVYMNGYAFGLGEYIYTPLATPPFSDAVIQTLSSIFIDGRFRTLFSLLFGAGLFIQWQRYKSTIPIKARLYWLIIFGLAHGFLLWAGDILFVYGVCGWWVLKFVETNNNMLLKRGIIFMLLACAVTFLFLMNLPDENIHRDSQAFIDLYSPHYKDYFISNLGYNMIAVVAVPFLAFLMFSGIMLIGIYLYKLEVFTKGLTSQQLFVCVSGAFVFTSLRLLIPQGNDGLSIATQELVNTFAALFIAVLYIHIIVKFCNNRVHVGTLIQQAGRLAFTLYISQTIMQLMLYKVLFPQWVLSFNRIDYWLVATALVIVQLLFTALYSRFYIQGPLEFIWRKLTQLKIST